jgi:hypothetical protein
MGLLVADVVIFGDLKITCTHRPLPPSRQRPKRRQHDGGKMAMLRSQPDFQKLVAETGHAGGEHYLAAELHFGGD